MELLVLVLALLRSDNITTTSLKFILHFFIHRTRLICPAHIITTFWLHYSFNDRSTKSYKKHTTATRCCHTRWTLTSISTISFPRTIIHAPMHHFAHRVLFHTRTARILDHYFSHPQTSQASLNKNMSLQKLCTSLKNWSKLSPVELAFIEQK